MRVLCLDIGTNMGWAAASLDAPPLPAPLLGDERPAREALRHYRYGVWKGPKLERGPFYDVLGEWLHPMLRTHRVSLVAVEASVEGWMNMGKPDRLGKRKTNPDTIRKLLGILAMVELTAARHGVPVKDVNTTAMQMLAVGTGRDTGKQKRKRRIGALGLAGLNADAMDAIYGLSWVLHDRQTARRDAQVAA